MIWLYITLGIIIWAMVSLLQFLAIIFLVKSKKEPMYKAVYSTDYEFGHITTVAIIPIVGTIVIIINIILNAREKNEDSSFNILHLIYYI